MPYSRKKQPPKTAGGFPIKIGIFAISILAAGTIALLLMQPESEEPASESGSTHYCKEHSGAEYAQSGGSEDSCQICVSDNKASGRPATVGTNESTVISADGLGCGYSGTTIPHDRRGGKTARRQKRKKTENVDIAPPPPDKKPSRPRFVEQTNPTHPASQMGIFECNGRWGDADFAITKFAGLEYGSSMYCQPGESGVGMGSAPVGEDGLYVPTDITRSATVNLGQNLMGYDNVETSYTYSSKQLKTIHFSKTFDMTDEGYASARDSFDSSIAVLGEQFGMPEPNCSVSQGRVDGRDELLYNAGSGSDLIIGGLRSSCDNKIEVYLLICDKAYGAVAKEEVNAAIANPPTKSIQNWVDGFKTNPRYFKRGSN